ncbi:MAG: diguanylate cyclase [Gammaproteobacteria bacterium]
MRKLNLFGSSLRHGPVALYRALDDGRARRMAWVYACFSLLLLALLGAAALYGYYRWESAEELMRLRLRETSQVTASAQAIATAPGAMLRLYQQALIVKLGWIYLGYLLLLSALCVWLGRVWAAQNSSRAAWEIAAGVIEASPDAVVVTDPGPRVIYVNRAFTAITGYSLDEVKGKNPRILSSGRQDRAFYEAFWARLVSEGHWEGEIWNRNKAGEVYAEWLRISALRGEQGKVRYYIAIFSDITARKQAEQHLEHLALRDHLTGLYNRAAFNDALRRTLDAARRRGTRAALIYMDLDRFKPINDLYGHAVGDAVLQQVAMRLQRDVRSTDTVARLGGDEFAIILADVDNWIGAELVASKLAEALAEPMSVQDLSLNIGASLGMAIYPDVTTDEIDLVKHADDAMYRAKQAGGGIQMAPAAEAVKYTR